MKYILTFALLLRFSSYSWTQADSTKLGNDFKRHGIHLSAGTLFWYGEWNINYERLYKKSTFEGATIFLGSQFGIGVSESFSGGSYFTSTARFLALTGAKNAHVEFNGGLSFNIIDTDGDFSANQIFSIFSPTISLGYRFQNLNKSRFIFRTGAGWPMGVYMGAGWNF